MTVKVFRYTPEEWKEYATASHLAVFDKVRTPGMDRITYALITADDSGVIGYVTCRELDGESLYWQYGGAVRERRGLAAVRSLEALLRDASGHYKRITTYIENDNIGYLHLAMKFGFRVIGIRYFEGHIFLELLYTFGGHNVLDTNSDGGSGSGEGSHGPESCTEET